MAATEHLHNRMETFIAGQNLILEKIASGADLAEVLASLVRLIEAQSGGMLCSILLLHEDGVHLRHGAAPSLPESYIKAIDGLSIGPTRAHVELHFTSGGLSSLRTSSRTRFGTTTVT